MWRGLLYQLGPASPDAFEELRVEVALAESLGLDVVWCLPHSSGGTPELWLAALAATSTRIRLGWGLSGVWPPIAVPLREAEQAASLDGASSGRLELALLPGGEAGEGAPDEPLDEGARMLVEMWAPETFSWTSARHSVPPIDVLPKPRQRPHPPLWLAGWTQAQAGAAGRAGLRFLDVSGGGLDAWRSARACYVTARARAKPDTLLGPASFAVAIDPDADGPNADATDLADRGGPTGSTGAAWAATLAMLEAEGVDGILVRARPLEGAHEAACRRIRRLAER